MIKVIQNFALNHIYFNYFSERTCQKELFNFSFFVDIDVDEFVFRRRPQQKTTGESKQNINVKNKKSK